MLGDNMALPHRCKCSQVTRCDIYTHPSSKVQGVLNELMDAMAEFDDETGSSSTLSFNSFHPTGVFTSLTQTMVSDATP